MALPDLIEILPLDSPVQARITVPGSKSITNRALILAALARGETTLAGALWSEDTQVMVDSLNRLGFEIEVEPDPAENGNRTVKVRGGSGTIPKGGSTDHPLEIYVANAGTAARFLAAFVCLGQGTYRLSGSSRMHERPQGALFGALRQLGYRVESNNDKLPARIVGAGPRAGRCKVSIKESSQFASALMLCARAGLWTVDVIDHNAELSAYVAMTSSLMRAFPKEGGRFEIEPDASSGSYFLGAHWLLLHHELSEACDQAARSRVPLQIDPKQLTNISVSGWPTSGWQADAKLLDMLLGDKPADPLDPGGTLLPSHPIHLNLPAEISREDDLGDSIMTAAVLAPFMGQMIRLTELGRLRLQETERVSALKTELTKCGVKVVEQGDTLTILPSRQELHGAEIETYNDHRMAMCFAILGLKVPGITLKNPACVKKTFPNFFQKLAAAPPKGLGVAIRDARTGRLLEVEELFAE